MTDYLICKSHELISYVVILETITNTMINYQNSSVGIDKTEDTMAPECSCEDWIITARAHRDFDDDRSTNECHQVSACLLGDASGWEAFSKSSLSENHIVSFRAICDVTRARVTFGQLFELTLSKQKPASRVYNAKFILVVLCQKGKITNASMCIVHSLYRRTWKIQISSEWYPVLH